MIKCLKVDKKLYFSLFKAVVPGVLFLIVLFSMFFASNNNKVITSLSKLFYEENEVALDNWEISTVFYDSTVNDGKTTLTEINWDASDGGYGEGETRTITVQINYKNTNTVTSYEPGKLKIEVNNLAYELSSAGLTTNRIVAGANDSTHTNYDWDLYNSNSPASHLETLVFTNAKTIEERTNFEGSIQIEYTIKVSSDSPEYHKDANNKFVALDSCIKTISKELTANINNQISSSPISFTFFRENIHPWTKANFELIKKATTVDSYDGLGDNAQDYIWVKYVFELGDLDTTRGSHPSYPFLSVGQFDIREYLPEGCRVFDRSFNQVNSVNGVYHITKYWNEYIPKSRHGFGHAYTEPIYVGYPKSVYNESNNNLNITNNAKLYGVYDGYIEESYLAEGSINIDLSDYYYSYSGDLYNINKRVTYSNAIKNYPEYTSTYKDSASLQPLYYEALIGEDKNLGSKGKIGVFINANARYSGSEMDIKFGDDLLFISDENGDYRKLNEDEYYFSNIRFPLQLKNANGAIIPENKYDCELWIKQGNNDYQKYAEFKNTNASYYYSSKQWSFSEEDNVTAYYFIIKKAKESIITKYENSPYDSTNSYVTITNTDNISKSGKVYNMAFLQVYIDGEVQNEAGIEDYNYSFTNFDIAQYDLNKYGKYLQRDYDYSTYSEFTLPAMINRISVTKDMTDFTQDVENEIFTGSSNLHLRTYTTAPLSSVSEYEAINYYHTIDPVCLSEGYELYDLLPKGMKLESSKEEILNSISSRSFNNDYRIINTSGKVYSDDEWRTLVKQHTTINVIKNYKNTQRTYISIVVDLSNNPIILYRSDRYYYNQYDIVSFSYDYSVSYDSYFENGKVYSNGLYGKYHNKYIGGSSSYFRADNYNSIVDNGNVDSDAIDIDNNGNSSEGVMHHSLSKTIKSVISTNQDVQVSVKSGDNYFETGKVDVPNSNEYTYKLRTRTGNNDVTNLVIYDSLEKYAKDSNMSNILASGGRGSWQGEFLGIDTSYAESKGYTVKTYYSENEEVGSLKDDDSWKIYTDSVDKSKVKSLAFEYLDSSDNPAVLPANSLTYILIKIKSPADEELKTLAYNGCWTEWNAIDPITGQTVDFITGINSNIVKVALPKSVEPVDIDMNIDKYWKDNNNSLGFRPDTINIQVVPNGDVTKAINVPLGSTNVDPTNPLHWSTIVSVPKYDENLDIIDYSLREGEIILDDGYKYTPSIEGNTITNTLMKEIELKKIWKDNTNSYLTRPTNVTYMVKQNGNDYKEVTFTGDYSTNEWSKKITVPVFDSSNNEYVYTIEEYNVDNYSGNCSELVCTNTLSGTKNITITKEWNDKNNEYSTRPDSIKVNLLRNGNLYQEVTINNTNWKSNNIEVPLYDENGVKYNYTISEDNVDEYGLVEYDQNSFKVTNSLKKKINLVIKKIWIDDNNSNNTRPSELQITLLRNNEEYQTVTLTGDTNEWTTSVEVDKYDSNFNKYKYSIKEVNDSISDLYSNVIYSEDELTVTNTLSQITNLTISKKWIDHDNEYLTRTDSVKVNLLQNGVLYREVTVSKNNNWKEIVSNVPVYDSNQNRYTYTIEESVSVSKYGKVTYDQTNLEVTNELTEVPTVSLYFTVVNGYVDPITGEMKYDDFGLNEIMKKYNVKAEDEYIFTFELKNLDSGKIYDGKLSTQGILEFKDIPCGEYKAVEGKDKLFNFVDMFSIEEVNGVSFRRVGNEGHISIRPTGENIIFGAKIVNKITPPMENPNTGVFVELFILLIVLLPIVYSLYFLSIKIKNG